MVTESKAKAQKSKAANVDDAFEKARAALPSPTEPDPGIMAAFSLFRTNEEKLRAVIYAIACSGGKGLAKDLRDFNTASRGVKITEVDEAADTYPTDKG